jgi:hypothetical protein
MFKSDYVTAAAKEVNTEFVDFLKILPNLAIGWRQKAKELRDHVERVNAERQAELSWKKASPSARQQSEYLFKDWRGIITRYADFLEARADAGQTEGVLLMVDDFHPIAKFPDELKWRTQNVALITAAINQGQTKLYDPPSQRSPVRPAGEYYGAPYNADPLTPGDEKAIIAAAREEVERKVQDFGLDGVEIPSYLLRDAQFMSRVMDLDRKAKERRAEKNRTVTPGFNS